MRLKIEPPLRWSRSRLLVLLVLVLDSGWTSCTRNASESQHRPAGVPVDSTLERVYVSGVEIGAFDEQEGRVDLIVRGELPNPAYRLERIAWELQGNRLILVPLARYDRQAIAVQMLVPFADTVAVQIGRMGRLDIFLQGRGESMHRAFEISSHK